MKTINNKEMKKLLNNFNVDIRNIIVDNIKDLISNNQFKKVLKQLENDFSFEHYTCKCNCKTITRVLKLVENKEMQYYLDDHNELIISVYNISTRYFAFEYKNRNKNNELNEKWIDDLLVPLYWIVESGNKFLIDINIENINENDLEEEDLLMIQDQELDIGSLNEIMMYLNMFAEFKGGETDERVKILYELKNFYNL
jgi:hypothetical protein